MPPEAPEPEGSEASFPIYLRAFDEAKRQATFIASTDAEDSYGEIVEQSWVLDRFKANPVILYGHQRSGNALPIGRAHAVGLVDGKLEVGITFASEKANPFAENVFQSVREDTLRAVSVGFRPGDARVEKRNGKEVIVLRNNVLYEISVVPIGANHEALAKLRAKALAAPPPERETTAMPPLSPEDEAKLRTELATERTKAADGATALATEKAKALQLEKDLTTERAAVAAARAANVKLELDAIVGVKLLPAEAADLSELAAENPERYKKMLLHVKARPDLTVLDKSKMGAEPEAAAARSVLDNGAAGGDDASRELDAEIEALT
jgi:HK97 family phage prohead protease